MRYSDLIRDIDITESDIPGDVEIKNLTSASSDVLPGSMFVCVKGLRHDGHAHIDEAVSRGAGIIVAERLENGIRASLKKAGTGFALTYNTRAALSKLWNTWYGCPADKMKLFAVTGTNGKTTTASMLRAIYELAGYKTDIIGTLTGSLTTPDPEDLYRILRHMADKGTECVFMEASSHALALDKLEPLRPDYGIFTNITPEHLDFHLTMENYVSSKSRLFSMCKTGIINLDDENTDKLLGGTSCEKLFYSAETDRADFSAKNIKLLSTSGIVFDFLTYSRLFRIRSPIPGGFTVYNALAAASCAYADGVHPEAITGAIRSFQGVKGRIERIRLPYDDFAVYIDFAHTPDALENILRTVRGFMGKNQRLILLFGCGGDRDILKRPVMGQTASRLADFVIVTSDNSRSEKPAEIIRQILKGIDKERPYTVIENRREAIEYAVMNAQKGDIILLAGKGHEEYEITSEGKRPFSEKSIVIEAAEKRLENEKE